MPIYVPILLAFLTLIVLAIIFAFFVKPKEKPVHDSRKYLTPNDTNYNIASHQPDVLENASPEEAREILKKVRQSKQPSLSNGDFYRLKEKVKSGDK